MLVLEVMQAKHGDCLLLRYGPPPGKVMVIDGGPAGTYRDTLLPRLQTLAKGRKLSIPLVVVSHIDDDHINGILAFFQDLEKGVNRDTLRPASLWHNALTELLPADLARALPAAAASDDINQAVTASFTQADDLRQAAKKLNVAVNYPVAGGPIVAGTKIRTGDFNIDITVLSPSKAQLAALRKRWPKPDADARTEACKDRSVYNLSSIVMLVRQDGKSILLTGDARGDHVVAALGDHGLLTDGQIDVDVYKVSHHGSEKNSEPATFKTIFARHYVISGDRVRHPENPSAKVVEWIVAARQEHRPTQPYTIWMSYPLPELAALVPEPGVVKTPTDGQDYLSIELA